MAVYDEEKLYNELMNAAPSAEQSAETQNSAAALKAGESYAVPGEYTGGIADQKLDEAINKYLSSRGFNYNTAEDPDYQAYVREYNENAKQGRALSSATAKTLANGYNPTYADTVSDEVYNSYMENVTDAIPQFKNLAAMENTGRENQLANAVNIYSTQSEKDYSRYRDTVGDKKNFLNYLYDRYATDRQSDVQKNADKASIYGTRLSSAQSNLENARNIDTQRYLYNTQSADNRAQLAQQELENQQKIAYQKAEDEYNARVAKEKEEQQNKENAGKTENANAILASMGVSKEDFAPGTDEKEPGELYVENGAVNYTVYAQTYIDTKYREGYLNDDERDYLYEKLGITSDGSSYNSELADSYAITMGLDKMNNKNWIKSTIIQGHNMGQLSSADVSYLSAKYGLSLDD
ncbi:MAG: hypothetical protein ACI4XI_10220 [Ruminococcus sp.]